MCLLGVRMQTTLQAQKALAGITFFPGRGVLCGGSWPPRLGGGGPKGPSVDGPPGHILGIPERPEPGAVNTDRIERVGRAVATEQDQELTVR